MTKKQKEIISVTIELIYERGYTETSVRDIANAIQIKAASLYSHFESKEDILKHICDDVQLRFHKISKEIEKSKKQPKELFKYFLKKTY